MHFHGTQSYLSPHRQAFAAHLASVGAVPRDECIATVGHAWNSECAQDGNVARQQGPYTEAELLNIYRALAGNAPLRAAKMTPESICLVNR
jgi:hypothetical protein